MLIKIRKLAGFLFLTARGGPQWARAMDAQKREKNKIWRTVQVNIGAVKAIVIRPGMA